jgi:hypothetical protein
LQLITTCLALAYLRRSLTQRTTGLVTGQPLSLARGFISPSVGFIGRSGPLLSNRMYVASWSLSVRALSQLLYLYQCSSSLKSRRIGYKLPHQAVRPRTGLCQPPGGHGKSAIGPALAPRLSMPPPGLLRARGPRPHRPGQERHIPRGSASSPRIYCFFLQVGRGQGRASEQRQQAASSGYTATKQAKASAAPNFDPLVRLACCFVRNLSRSPARACAKYLAVSAPLRAASRSHTDMSSSCLLQTPMCWPLATTADPLVGFRCCFVLWASGSGVRSQICEAEVDWPTHAGARKRQQAARASTKHQASTKHHHAGATGSCLMWTYARAPRPHHTCLCEISRGLRTSKSRETTSHGPEFAQRHEQLLPPPGIHMATTADPLVGFRCSFVLWASGSGVAF